MFRNGLLLSTAMTAVTLLLSGAPARASAQTNMHVVSRDANTEFLCNYGGVPVSAHFIGSASSFSSTWTHVAVPIIGHGKSVGRITVKEVPSASTSTAEFRVGIYSNTASGPGKLLSGGTGDARNNCGKVTVQIRPVKLKRNVTYWIEERVHRGMYDMKNEVYWASDPKMKRKAYEQTHSAYNYFGNNGSYTSPWMELKTGAHFKLK